MSYNCDLCGCCCLKVGDVVLSAQMQLYAATEAKEPVHPIIEALATFPYEIEPDGACSKFDRTSRICKVYESRPGVCNTDYMYNKFWKDMMTRDQWYQQSRATCLKLQQGDRT